MRWLLDRVMLAYQVLVYLSGAAALSFDLAKSEDPVIRRQLKYLRNGAIIGILPFALCYALPYVLGALPTHLMNLTVLSMALIPLTWAYAITRYRLMDVDIIFQQGYVYTLATLAVIGTFYGLSSSSSSIRSAITPPAFVVLISFATLRVSAHPALDSGTAGPMGFLSGPIRRAPHDHRICPRAIF